MNTQPPTPSKEAMDAVAFHEDVTLHLNLAIQVGELQDTDVRYIADMAEVLHRKALSIAFTPLRARIAELEVACKESQECAEAIRRSIDEDTWSCAQDPLWVPTIRAHAYVIWQDCRAALALLDGHNLNTEKK